MREPRNPFRMRTSEQIESDATFLRLFGPGVLDVLPKDDLFTKVLIFRSAPGGGKTSLLRLFTPSVLTTLFELRTNEDYSELYKSLIDLNVMSDDGPNILGVMLSCARNYPALEDLDCEPLRKERLLFSLLNARIILVALRGILEVRKLTYPKDLGQISITNVLPEDTPAGLETPISGEDLYGWARDSERRICEAIDSFGPSLLKSCEGNDTLVSLAMMQPGNVLCDGKLVSERFLVMFDDVHKLTNSQREKLVNAVLDLKSSTSVWLAERFEALAPRELLGMGAINGRDYHGPINIEEYWIRNTKKFEKLMGNIADRRARSAGDIQVSSFSACLAESLDGLEWQSNFEEAFKRISERVRKRVGTSSVYSGWMRAKEEAHYDSARTRALQWRALEILIERDISRSQRTLEVGMPLPDNGLESLESSGLASAADFFMSKEFELPYCYGMNRLAVLASSNIDQFLGFAGDMFEEIISSVLLEKNPVLLPNRQDAILRKLVRQKWEEIPRRVPFGRDVKHFLEGIQQLATLETNRPTAPYSPGVTGIAVSMEDSNRLIQKANVERNAEYEKVLRILSTCIAYKLLEASPDRSQGQRGKTWMIFYLNRWLCLHFGLPLQYGGWRPRTLAQLIDWLGTEASNHKKNETRSSRRGSA